MVPLYDYACDKCEHLFVEFKKLDDYDEPGKCPKCESSCEKVFVTPPNVRTAKLSRTFLDGQRAGGDMKNEIRAAELDYKRLEYHHESEDNKEMLKEIDSLRSLKK